MDLLDILRACLKRWYVFVPVVGLTAWLAAGQYLAAQPQYTATTSALVVPSRDLIVARGAQGMGGAPVTTPFNGGGGATSLAGMLTAALSTSTVRQELLPGGGVLLTPVRNPTSDTELVSVTVTANSEARATKAVEVLGTGINQVLANLQLAAGAPEGQLYVAAPGGPSDPPTVSYPDRLRGVVGVSLAGVLAAVVLSILVQALARGGAQNRVPRQQTKVRRGPVSARKRTTTPQHPSPQPEAGGSTGEPWWSEEGEEDLPRRRSGFPSEPAATVDLRDAPALRRR